ncbi:carotenoid 9,10(9',10')-cleavage dioxygenase 1-like isoform X2 [Argentina anserina]|uniref:carotenoid 9,10(9',10')-cleavage dioxygenase 1-like isoform X2 n=1 Tax=Argentina anserina TaxID=57926 RepID=UPI00217649E4|nr:carotenoid 9,10(9',10')-cleavage dioxygenase 1-like isoform X2 [Potentilla anserina]
MACSSCMGMAFQINCSVQNKKPSAVLDNIEYFKTTLSTAVSKQPLILRSMQVPMHIDVLKIFKNASVKLLDAFVDSVFEFIDQPLLPSQKNFIPVDELEGGVVITSTTGSIPDDFTEGVYVRNGPNPLFGGLKSTKSVFGRSNHIWIEGEGMLHALYFRKNDFVNSDGSRWTVQYNNRHVETETYKLERQRNRPSFLPAIGGDSPAILSAYLLNLLRFGKVNKYLSNTNVFEHSGKFYSIAENHIPQEIDILTLETLGNWDVSGAWNRPFTSHPKRAPGTGELVIMGVEPVEPFWEVGVVSADGKELIHKVDLKLNRCSICHEIGVTKRYNVIMDIALTIDIKRLIGGGPLVKYDEEEYARIGVMPRYGDASSVRWFKVEPNCTFHIINSFEAGDEVVVWGCKALDSVIGPINQSSSDNDSTSTAEDACKLYSHAYEWRLNMETGEVRERYLTGQKFSMDFPMINGNFTGLKNRFGYAQVVDSVASSTSGLLKYGGIAKLHFEEPAERKGGLQHEEIKVERHVFEKNTFCSGAAFVPRQRERSSTVTGHEEVEEDDGWVITFVHNEDTDISQVYVIDTKDFCSEPVAKITLPCRVPYGFHGAFMPI